MQPIAASIICVVGSDTCSLCLADLLSGLRFDLAQKSTEY